ncbi:LOW QUALITY PROTEIN: olfactory receptor 1J4-like [Pteronotus mesoamericanus]|uniref:LOW QUALITY PROTEIN: olfactory receptor 1J4-like n=1 Tax=Pteronotus mesoamericanus TaxID=1884717 RepID=UPI0023EAC357|nr:LOW QUALITY PROTEIN: olfactory receptor 1J4-like [Pteronotus parnellii mesoamericanus]
MKVSDIFHHPFTLSRQRKTKRRDNQSGMSEFLLLGLPVPPGRQGAFSTLFLGMYLTTVLGNPLILLLIRLDSRLHTPMYFFLSHLALTDVCFSSVTVPKMLMNMNAWGQSIPYVRCVTQMYFCIFFGCIDNLLLGMMAYDWYRAICHPLHYTTIMPEKMYISLLAVSWFFSCSSAMSHTLSLARLSFCADNTIPHFFCDLVALLKLSCSYTSLNRLVILTVGALGIIIPLSGILVSDVHIGVSILRVSSAKGMFKALSTSGSHLSVVCLFYGTIMVLYLFPSSNNSNDKDTIASVMCKVVTPMLNPFIWGVFSGGKSFSPSENRLTFSVLSSPNGMSEVPPWKTTQRTVLAVDTHPSQLQFRPLALRVIPVCSP